MAWISDIPALRKHVDKSGGASLVKARTVRDACGHQRLGTGVRQEISEALDAVGLSYLPLGEFPGDQDAELWIYDKARLGWVVDAVIKPSHPVTSALLLMVANAQSSSRAEEGPGAGGAQGLPGDDY